MSQYQPLENTTYDQSTARLNSHSLGLIFKQQGVRLFETSCQFLRENAVGVFQMYLLCLQPSVMPFSQCDD